MRKRAVDLAIASLLLIAASTEAFSAMGALNWVWLAWIPILAIWIFGFERKGDWNWWYLPSIAIWLVEGIAALVSPPNSSDAMAYHMPRVVMWMQQRSVENFATPYLNQIMLQPLHEYVTLHLQLITGGDWLANCVAWVSTLGYIAATSLVAQSLGAGVRGQALAAFLAATLPNGILQASGAKNEALLAFLVVSAVYYALEKKLWHMAAAVGLACFTKGTAFLFLFPLIPVAWWRVALCVVVINGPFFMRNIDLSGSPLGFDSAHGDGKYRWRNEYFGWQPVASNLIRHATEQVGHRSDAWNRGVYDASLRLHSALGLSAADPAMTWPLADYIPPKSANHETDTNNKWHLGLLFVAAVYFAIRRDRKALYIVGGIAAGVLVFCLYLKWQPFMLRMWLPLFALGMGLAGVALARAHVAIQAAICLFLLTGTRLPLLKSWVRPLTGEHSMFAQTRDERYYNDMTVWKVQPQFEGVVWVVNATPCRELAIDINRFQLEYPLMAQIKNARWVHVNVNNASKKYENRTPDVKPCALICLACDNWYQRLP